MSRWRQAAGRLRAGAGIGAGVATLLAGLSTGAHGADRATPTPHDATHLPSFGTWAGGYIGWQGSAGDAFGDFGFGSGMIGRRSVPEFRTGDATGRNDAGRDATTALGGLFGGYAWQIGPFVYGLEADVDASNLKRPVSSTTPGTGFEGLDPAFPVTRTKADVFGTARARVGYAFERYLVYASFGLAGAQVRFLTNFPDPGTTSAPALRRGRAFLGFSLGAGIEYAITENLALGLEYRYLDLGRSGRLDLGTVPGVTGGPFSARASFTSNQVLARLSWYPGGLVLPPEPGEVAPHDPDTAISDRVSLHGQTTFVDQGVSGFRSPYLGPQSLVPRQARATLTATAFLGFKLTDSTELYYNPEFDQGFGLSRTLGVAGFVNGEAQKAGAPFPKFRSQRYFVRQTFGLGGETEDVPDGPNQVATRRDIERITVVAGKFALGDFFDGNTYAHDPRVDFLNWSLWASGAYDFPANLPGFTQGVMVEYNRKAFAIRAAYTQVPKEPSSNVLDPRIARKGGLTVELEERHVLPGLDQPGKIRLGLFTNVARTANYREVVALTQGGFFADINDAAAATRRDRRKSGLYLNLEQAVTSQFGVFARASLNDGRNESLSFADIDRSVSGGVSLKGGAWGRPDDTVGLGAALNNLSRSHRDFFANGGLGLVIGDGRLSYRAERAAEAYYALSLTKAVTVSADYQLVANPAYNRDRGPAHFFAARLHTDF